MKKTIEKLFPKQSREEAFTLIEIVVAILIIGVLTAIAVPAFFKYKAELDSQAEKAEMQTAALLIEQEQIDNNGLYPTYIPNEVKANKIMSKYIYTYSKDRTQFCIQANTASGKWFVSSEDKQPSRNVCTQSEVGSNSETPWRAPTVPVPNVISYGNFWATNAPSSLATVKVNEITCGLDAVDAEEWGGATTASYRLKVVNTTLNQTIITEWLSATTLTTNFTLGWLPDHAITYQVQGRCTIASGTPYTYLSDYSAPIDGIVHTFDVTPSEFTSGPTLEWKTGANNPIHSASWSSLYCPAGDKQYAIQMFQGGVSKYSTGYQPWIPSISDVPLSGVTSNQNVVLDLISACNMATKRVTAKVSVNLVIPLKPPAAPTGLTTYIDPALDASYAPNGLKWTPPVACQVGALQYNVRNVVTGTSTGWTATNPLPRVWVPGTTYTYDVQAKCKSGSVESEPSVWSAPHTFKVDFTKPANPTKPGGLVATSIGSTSSSLKWNVVNCTTPGSAAQYRAVWVSPAGVAATAWSTAVTANSNAHTQGTVQTWKVEARCERLGQFSDVISSDNATFTSAVAAPTGSFLAYRNGERGLTSSTVTCAQGGTVQYQVVKVSDNSMAGSNTDYGFTTTPAGSVDAIEGSTISVKMQARCLLNGIYSITQDSNTVAWKLILYRPTYPTASYQLSGTAMRYYAATWNAADCGPNVTRRYHADFWRPYNSAGATTMIWQPRNIAAPSIAYWGSLGIGTYTAYYTMYSFCVNPSAGVQSGYSTRRAIWNSTQSGGLGGRANLCSTGEIFCTTSYAAYGGNG